MTPYKVSLYLYPMTKRRSHLQKAEKYRTYGPDFAFLVESHLKQHELEQERRRNLRERTKGHAITWFVYAGGERMRHQSTMRGFNAWDATCSCGWETRTGGGVRSWVQELVTDHKYDVMTEGDN